MMSMSKPQKRKLSESVIDKNQCPSPNPPAYSEKPLLQDQPVLAVKTDPQTTQTQATAQAEPQQQIQQGDERLVTAAEVLTQLAHSPTPSNSSPGSSIGSPSIARAELDSQQHPIVQLVSAVSRLPIVTNAVKYYENSKRNYSSFNYAAEFVERAAMPVFNKIEVNLNSIHQARLEERRRKKRRVDSLGRSNNEIKKRLKFCLHILKLANDNINNKVSGLQQAIQDHEEESRNKQLSTPVSDEKAEELSQTHHEVADLDSSLSTTALNQAPQDAQETKTEIVATVKKIIHVISNFRPSALASEKSAELGPEAEEKMSEDVKLKSTIREIILNLPQQIQQNSSPQTNDKIIVFAKESLNMIGKLTTVLNDQLQKAETWVDGGEQAGGAAVEVKTETETEAQEAPVAELRQGQI